MTNASGSRDSAESGASEDGSDNTRPEDAGPTIDTGEPRLSGPREDLMALTFMAVAVSIAALVLAGIAVYFRVPGAASFAYGLIWGCFISLVNLHVLARAIWSLLRFEVGFALVGFGLSLLFLLSASAWLVLNHPEWALGYGCGLGLPAAAGVAYALAVFPRSRDSSE